MAEEAERLYRLAYRAMRAKIPDHSKAYQNLVRAAELGHPMASYALATWYLNGVYVKRNYRRAVALLRVAARARHPDALFDLAVCYENGEGVRKSERLAMEHYMLAALYGEEESLYEVGRGLYYGIGLTKNRRLARLWLEAANKKRKTRTNDSTPTSLLFGHPR